MLTPNVTELKRGSAHSVNLRPRFSAPPPVGLSGRRGGTARQVPAGIVSTARHHAGCTPKSRGGPTTAGGAPRSMSGPCRNHTRRSEHDRQRSHHQYRGAHITRRRQRPAPAAPTLVVILGPARRQPGHEAHSPRASLCFWWLATASGPVDPTDSPARHQEELEQAGAPPRRAGRSRRVRDGDRRSGRAIAMLADERDIDLVVVGTCEPGLVERIMCHSVSAQVARRVPRDLVIVHPTR